MTQRIQQVPIVLNIVLALLGGFLVFIVVPLRATDEQGGRARRCRCMTLERTLMVLHTFR